MISSLPTTSGICRADQIAAYIDGELAFVDEMSLEQHLSRCARCGAELNAQKRFLHSIDVYLKNGDEIELPENFAAAVITAAESSVVGLRRRAELRRAALIFASLFVLAALSSALEVSALLSGIGIAAQKFFAAADLAVHFIFDAARGIAAVCRVLASQFIFRSVFNIGLFAGLTLFSLAIFSRLLNRERRT